MISPNTKDICRIFAVCGVLLAMAALLPACSSQAKPAPSNGISAIGAANASADAHLDSVEGAFQRIIDRNK